MTIHRFFPTVRPLLLYPVALLWLLFLASPADAQLCGSLQNAFGPYDYTDPAARQGKDGHPAALDIVERFHFSEEVESLARIDHKGSVDARSLLGDLDYTLRAFPNHHRALYAVSKLEQQVGRLPQLQGMRWPRSAACYFERAQRFRSNDPIVHLLQGIHLHRTGSLGEALKAYQRSEKLYPNSADLQYNMGLLQFDLGDYPLAKKYAERAYELGHTKPGLRNRLARAGHWP